MAVVVGAHLRYALVVCKEFCVAQIKMKSRTKEHAKSRSTSKWLSKSQARQAGRHFEQFVTQMNRRKSSQKTQTVAPVEVGKEENEIQWEEAGSREQKWRRHDKTRSVMVMIMADFEYSPCTWKQAIGNSGVERGEARLDEATGNCCSSSNNNTRHE